MSFQFSVSIKSGFFQGSAKSFKKQIKDDIDAAILDATEDLLTNIMPEVAKVSGRLRKSLEKMINDQVASLQGRNKVSFAFRTLTTPLYGTYHVFGPSGEAKSTRPYKHRPSYLKISPRTTLGTKPVNERAVIKLWRALIENQLAIELRKSGFKFTQVVNIG